VDQSRSAKVQIGAPLLCKGAKVEYESIEYGVSSIGRDTDTGGGWRASLCTHRYSPLSSAIDSVIYSKLHKPFLPDILSSRRSGN
jgi:hypothetical protein